MDCRSCSSGLDHCHGTLIMHETGEVDCTQACTDLDLARHRLSLRCAEVDGGCLCVAEPTPELAWARRQAG